jgi:hypothetical protein
MTIFLQIFPIHSWWHLWMQWRLELPPLCPAHRAVCTLLLSAVHPPRAFLHLTMEHSWLQHRFTSHWSEGQRGTTGTDHLYSTGLPGAGNVFSAWENKVLSGKELYLAWWLFLKRMYVATVCPAKMFLEACCFADKGSHNKAKVFGNNESFNRVQTVL